MRALTLLDESPFQASDASPICGTGLHGKPDIVHTKGGKEVANYLSNLQITFLRHGRQMRGALCF